MCNFCNLFWTTIFCFAVGLLPYFDNFAHLGGFLAGLLLGLGLLIRERSTPMDHDGGMPLPTATEAGMFSCQNLTRVLALVLVVAGAVSLTTVLYRGIDPYTTWCPWCHYLSCIPTPWWTCPSRAGASTTKNRPCDDQWNGA